MRSTVGKARACNEGNSITSIDGDLVNIERLGDAGSPVYQKLSK